MAPRRDVDLRYNPHWHRKRKLDKALPMYRAVGPAEMRPVGEIEFANGVVAMAASGTYGKTRVCAGIACIAAFGPNRAMFESNFPVDKGSCGYAALWNAFKRIAAGYVSM
jgi:hypothetical protein